MSNPSQYIKSMNPRNMEIMSRILEGQKQVQISRDMGISQVRISMIVRSPLFKLELKRQLIKKYERLLTIQDNLLEASEKGSQLYKDIIDGAYTAETKIKAGVAAQAMLMKLLQLEKSLNSEMENPSKLEGEGTYEEHLRKVTIEEKTTTSINNNVRPSNGNGDSTKAEDKEVETLLLDYGQLDESMKEEERLFEKGEEILN